MTPSSNDEAPGKVYSMDENGVSSPVPIRKVDANYTEEARRAKIHGNVLLALVVDQNGNPRDIKVEKPLGMGLEEKAIEAVQKWKFQPATKNGRPVAMHISVAVNFRLL
jgi:TonB family protein